MKQFYRKAVPVALAMLTLLLVLTGCGTQSSASSAPGTATSASTADAQRTSDPNLMTSQQQVKAIDVKTDKGQKQLNAQINKNLNNLDKSLNDLDKSLGSL
ncbi:hypothetical protein REC12_22880 [Desulfosporosinus sp. PR]|uniref:hypothetical protein n=1 Tax=Candidatus Desulfosporosinus nitrosoreducens TaxID=3401928 RepID=UPI0027F59BB0|nr:hypothetical protein [Desulfosporosinus sp. PR]MDQ7096445.1 hypothetical protein [Desulfosporosinus sp. PR]